MAASPDRPKVAVWRNRPAPGLTEPCARPSRQVVALRDGTVSDGAAPDGALEWLDPKVAPQAKGGKGKKRAASATKAAPDDGGAGGPAAPKKTKGAKAGAKEAKPKSAKATQQRTLEETMAFRPGAASKTRAPLLSK